jgi:hypothetical protein
MWIEPFLKPEMTIVPVELVDVANEHTPEPTFFLNISAPSSLRQENNGKRWQVFPHVSRTSSNSFFTLGHSSLAYDINLPRTQIYNIFSIAYIILFIILVQKIYAFEKMI